MTQSTDNDAVANPRLGIGGKRKKLLTIATPVINDQRGVAMTLMSLRSQLESKIDYVDFIIVDNDPTTVHGKKTRSLANAYTNCRYIGLSGEKSPFIAKDMCIRAAQTEYVLVIDSHVILAKNAALKLLAFVDSGVVTNDLYHGPICNEQFGIMATHMNPIFGNNFGRWGRMLGPDKRTLDPDDYYEIPLHGMGCFFCRRDTWPGFNPAFMGFGSEEGYIHEKYRLNGNKVWSMPFLKWWHNFGDDAVQAQCDISWPTKYRNGLIAWSEIGLPLSQINTAYGRHVSPAQMAAITDHVLSLGIQPLPRPVDYKPFLGYPVRIYDDANPSLADYTRFENPRFFSGVSKDNGVIRLAEFT